jgi:hypothetical protein
MADNNENRRPAAMYTCDECSQRKYCEMKYENERTKMVRCTEWRRG